MLSRTIGTLLFATATACGGQTTAARVPSTVLQPDTAVTQSIRATVYRSSSPLGILWREYFGGRMPQSKLPSKNGLTDMIQTLPDVQQRYYVHSIVSRYNGLDAESREWQMIEDLIQSKKDWFDSRQEYQQAYSDARYYKAVNAELRRDLAAARAAISQVVPVDNVKPVQIPENEFVVRMGDEYYVAQGMALTCSDDNVCLRKEDIATEANKLTRRR